MLRGLILFKKHENVDCDKLLNITRYLFAKGYDIRPKNVWEDNMPAHINILPTIVLPYYHTLEGLNEIVEYYENNLKIVGLLEKAETFTKLNPNYRITDRSTHKNLKMLYL